ncbi:MAG: PEP/pyruvate-binding domain-containing protein [Solirubrobacteraceae bacterium]
MTDVVSLVEAADVSLFGSKAVGLGDALRDGLPVPPGIALSGQIVDAVAGGDVAAIERVAAAAGPLGGPLAVRSSAVDEDGAEASFAWQHLTLLNVPSSRELQAAVREIWWSANSDSAIGYRQRVGMFTRPSVGVVVQALLNPDAAGVMFTRNPVTGEDERVIEASLGLGEAVVAGLVIPDTFRLARSGEVLDRTAGLKKIAVRTLREGGTVEEPVPPELSEKLCINDAQLAALGHLAEQCDRVYGPARDIEWAVAGGTVYLLQCRAITRAGSSAPAPAFDAVPGAVLERVTLFGDLDEQERAEIGHLLRERRFAVGETVIQEGSGGSAFYVIVSGEARVLVGGEWRATLGPGAHFGEIALIDQGARTATIVAASDLVCHGITYWDFRPLVERNGSIGWKLLQGLARLYRSARGA